MVSPTSKELQRSSHVLFPEALPEHPMDLVCS
jgi:hypothetical protein